jgi:hypothetical protein
MKKLVLACTMLLVVAAISAPKAEALDKCLKWVQFCDGVHVGGVGANQGSWYHFDCANDSPMDVSGGGAYTSNCGTNGKRRLTSNAGNGPGAYYFIVDLPADGTLDMHQGVYPNGTCWIPGLAYNLSNGACTGLQGQAARSSVQ